jgi:tRNA threonylcarbamoyladenosine biosynthesis protein TsaB
MSLIISLETSTNVCSVALHKDAQLISCSEILVQKSHSSLLTVMIQQCVEQAGFGIEDLSAVAVSAGPGSYTGLRIGSSVAKGLCFSLDIPFIAIDTLEAMAVLVSEFVEPNCLLCPMIDARRMEVYYSLLDKSGKVFISSIPKVLDVDSFSAEMEKHELVFFGNGSEKFSSLIGIKHNAKFLNGIYPSAKGVGVLAAKKFELSDFENTIYFEPNYLKEFVSASQLK